MDSHPVYKALHRPLTVWGVDRRLFFLALMMGAAMFNLFYSFLAALLNALKVVDKRAEDNKCRIANLTSNLIHPLACGTEH